MYRNLLSAVDGSFHSELAARYAVAIASSLHSKVTVLAVDTGEVDRVELSSTVDNVCRYAHKNDVEAKGAVKKGETVETVLETIPSENIDLLIAATRRGERRMFVRSITQKLMVDAPCSMLAVKPVRIAKVGNYILLPVSNKSMALEERLTLCESLAKFFKFQVEVFHVVERQKWYYLPWSKQHQLRVHGEENMKPLAQELEKRGADAYIRARLSEDSIGAIIKESVIGRHSLMLVGATRRNFLKRVISGNPIERLLTESPCNVVVWRPRK